MDRVLNTSTEVPEHPPDGRWKDSHGYIWLRWSGVGVAREHRVVMRAEPGTHVHHLNGIRDDNRPENLEVHLPTEHLRIHADSQRGSYRTLAPRRCVICGVEFHPKNSTSATCKAPECVVEHHRRSARVANQQRWADYQKMTEEERVESARDSRRRWRERQKQSGPVDLSDLPQDLPSDITSTRLREEAR
jgi:predicted Zn-ribbon and HTH transcriptional regulator